MKSIINMGKKELITISAIAAAVVILTVVLAIVFSGKNKNPTDNTLPTESTSPIELDIKTIDTSLHIALDILEQDTANDPTFLTAVDSKNGYEVLSFKQTGTDATAVVKVYSPDLYSIAKKLDSDGITRTEEELLEAIANEVANAQIVESEIELEFTVTADGCVPVLTSEFLDALYGEVFRLYDDMLSSN